MRFATTDREPLPHGRAPARPLIAIGDIHGYSDALAALQEQMRRLIETEYSGQAVDLVYLGDYVDRGPDPKGVIALVDQGLGIERVNEVALMGNHDWFLIAAAGLRGATLSSKEWGVWLANGGRETLEALDGLSYRSAEPARVREALGPRLCARLEALELSFATGRVFCAHAGVDPKKALDKQTQQNLLWIRGDFLLPAEKDGPWPPDVTVVHGHTPNAYGLFPHRIGVDTGGFATGVFSAVEVTEAGVRFHHLDRED